jgi:hypothetical protein
MTMRDEVRQMLVRGSDRRTSPCFGASDTNPSQSRGADDNKNLDFALKIMEEFRTTPLES